MDVHNAADLLPKVTSQKGQGTESENAYNCPIVYAFGHYIRKAIAPKARNRGTSKLEFEV